jgi:adenylate cyclase
VGKALTIEEQWRTWLTRHGSPMRLERGMLRRLPSDPRCKICNAPFGGPGGLAFRLLGRRPWEKNPNFCTTCSRYATKYRGGAEVELSLLFADARGSTTLAERTGASEFTALMNRFYAAATRVLLDTDAVIDKLVGDEVIGLYLPFLGERHARLAVDAARRLLWATGHGAAGGPWLPVGVGVHTGRAFVGIVGTEEITDFTALGDAVNLTARLASAAGAGEALITEEASAAAGLTEDLERRDLTVRGREERVRVWVLRVGEPAPVAPS